jgi:glycosyltransferase involved in cell wall biosynthesis
VLDSTSDVSAPHEALSGRHIGLNLVYLVPGETGGMETYARELISALVTERSDVRFTAFVNREASEQRSGPWHELVRSVTVPVRARNRLEWVRGEQQLLPRVARAEGVDLVHSLASTAPTWGPFRRVVTIHDLIYRIHPDAHFGLRSVGMRVLIPLAARRSHRIIATSASTKNDILQFLKPRPAAVDVVPLGVGTKAHDALSSSEIRTRHGLGDRQVVLSASAKRPHKNLVRLLQAVAAIRREMRPVLVLPGYPTAYEAELRRQAAELGIDDDVRFLGWVSPEELEGLYAVAAAFVFPSLYEGFGLPVVEAMARGVPVACSDRSSLAEVAGSAALMFDPEDVPAIAGAIERLLSDHGEADRLRALGREQAARFTWQATARGTLASYERALGRNPS